MNGPGFQCDDCGKTVILQQHPVLVLPTVFRDLPEGWFVQVGPDPGQREIFTDRHEFCSIACVAEYAHNAVESMAREVAAS